MPRGVVGLVAAISLGCGSPSATPVAPRASSGVEMPAKDRDDPFWSDPDAKPLITTLPVTGRLHVALVRVLGEETYGIVKSMPMQTAHVVPLAALLDANPSRFGAGDHLTVTNIRGEQLYLRRDEIRQHAPVIVIGIDDQRNLVRLATTYQLRREYTWRVTSPEPPPAMTRPIGAFLFFPNGVDDEDTTTASFTLTPSSFRLSARDPLAPIRAAPISPSLLLALTGGDGCLKCHALRGAGARAHHVRASDGKPHGGFALALEEYPRDVLERFLFEQDKVAASFGVEPLHVDAAVAKELFAFTARK